MNNRISRRLFLSGAALLSAGIVLDRLGQGEQMSIVEEDRDGVFTPAVATTQAQETTPTVIPPKFTLSVLKADGNRALTPMVATTQAPEGTPTVMPLTFTPSVL